MLKRLWFVAVVGLVLAPAVALAQETGTVSGNVFERNGSPVAGATVKISGDAMPVARTTRTSTTGAYSFLALLPGTYVIEVEKAGVGKVGRGVVVSVGRDTQAEFILGAVTEEVTVTAVPPAVDLKSTEVSFNFTRDFIQDLPLDRSYLGLLQLIPGIAENGSFAPNGGGSRQDNTYLVDGVNITNPLFGYLGTEVNELDVVEVNAKRGAITADFGRSAGFVSNAVTRSGTNRFSGSYRFEAIPNEWIHASKKTIRSNTDRWVNAASAGGPIVKDRLFFYASARIFRSKGTRSANLFGPLPDRKDRTNEVFGKVTAPIGSSQFVNVSYRHRPSEADYAGIGANDAPTVGTNSQGTNRVVSASYDWFLNSRTTVTVKYLHMDEQNETVAITDLGFQPPFDVNNLPKMGRVVIGGVGQGGASLRLNRQNYYRNEVKATIGRFFDFAGMTHQVKGGFGYDEGVEDLTRKSNGWGDISNVTVSGQPRIRANYYPEQPTQLSKGRTYSIFLQDDISLTPRLTVNAGLLLSKDEFIQELPNLVPASSTTIIQTGTFLAFGFSKQVQPRIGFNYQLRKGRGDKVYANWGRFYGLDQKSSARALASGRLYTENADFDPVTGALISQAPQANTVSKNIRPGTTPPFMDEVVFGYATPLGDGWSMDAFFLYRDTDSFIEDIPTVLPFSTFVYQNDPVADRKYKTLALELNRHMRDRWSMNVSYAWSKLYGNYDQDYSGGLGGAAVFNTSSLINDGPGSFAADTFRQGVLSQDRPHVFKVLATWMPEWIENLSLGTYVRAQSGTPWEARGFPWGSGATLLRLLEPVGTNRNPMWLNTDLLVKYGIPVDSRRTARLELRILNLFNQETVLFADRQKFLNPRNQTVIGTPPADCLPCWTDAYTAAQPTTQPNPNFGKPQAYASPRRLLMSFLFDF